MEFINLDFMQKITSQRLPDDVTDESEKSKNEHHSIALFQQKKIRRVWHQGQWYFSVTDVVEVLSSSNDVRQYVKKLRSRDAELSIKWGTICTPLDLISQDGKKRKENCAPTEGMLRIIQSIPSPPNPVGTGWGGTKRVERGEMNAECSLPPGPLVRGS